MTRATGAAAGGTEGRSKGGVLGLFQAAARRVWERIQLAVRPEPTTRQVVRRKLVK